MYIFIHFYSSIGSPELKLQENRCLRVSKRAPAMQKNRVRQTCRCSLFPKQMLLVLRSREVSYTNFLELFSRCCRDQCFQGFGTYFFANYSDLGLQWFCFGAPFSPKRWLFVEAFSERFLCVLMCPQKDGRRPLNVVSCRSRNENGEVGYPHSGLHTLRRGGKYRPTGPIRSTGPIIRTGIIWWTPQVCVFPLYLIFRMLSSDPTPAKEMPTPWPCNLIDTTGGRGPLSVRCLGLCGHGVGMSLFGLGCQTFGESLPPSRHCSYIL